MGVDNEKKKIVGIGLNGLVGSRVTELLAETYDFENFSTSTGFDITKKETLNPLLESDATIVLHLAAKTDVDGCEDDKKLGEKGDAWQINVEGVRNIAEICQKTGKKMVYISTDFVFDGENTPQGGYGEDDLQNPINWYGKTKYEGEKIVQALGASFLIVRLAYPYRAKFDTKKDFVRAIAERLQAGKPVAAVADHYMSPTYIDDFVHALDVLLHKDISGIYHTVGSEAVTPYDASLLIAHAFNLDGQLVSRTTRAEYFKDKGPRGFNLSLNNDKIRRLGVSMRTFQEGLLEIKQQL